MKYGKMGRAGARAKSQMGGGMQTPHPTGGDTRSLNPNQGRMPNKSGGSPITHTPLDCEPSMTRDGNNWQTSGKMPKQMSGARQVTPHRR